MSLSSPDNKKAELVNQMEEELHKIAKSLRGFQHIKDEAKQNDIPLDSNVQNDLVKMGELAKEFEGEIGRFDKNLNTNLTQEEERIEKLEKVSDKLVIDLTNKIIYEAEQLTEKDKYKPSSRLLVLLSRGFGHFEEQYGIRDSNLEKDFNKIEEELKEAAHRGNSKEQKKVVEKHLESLKNEIDNDIHETFQKEMEKSIKEFKELARQYRN